MYLNIVQYAACIRYWFLNRSITWTLWYWKQVAYMEALYTIRANLSWHRLTSNGRCPIRLTRSSYNPCWLTRDEKNTTCKRQCHATIKYDIYPNVEAGLTTSRLHLPDRISHSIYARNINPKTRQACFLSIQYGCEQSLGVMAEWGVK